MTHKQKLHIFIFFTLLVTTTKLAFAGPASTNYQLKQYGFGAGGTDNSTSTNYKLNGVAGEIESGQQTSTNYKLNGGLNFTQQANVPPAPTLSNGSGTYYNKITCTLVTGNNPTTTEFAIAISPDAFSSITKYVQADNTLGTSPVWQTNTVWGASGFTIVGLTSSTTYTVKVAARMGSFTQTGFGPSATIATVAPSITFSISPNTINFGTLTPGSVIDSPAITINFATNANSGGKVYIYGANAGLLSAHSSHTISSLTGNLTPQAEGSGGQVTGTSQSSGGPLAISSPYDGTSNVVGIIDTSIRDILATTSPIVGGQATLLLKAKASATTPASNDYSETLTVIASGNF